MNPILKHHPIYAAILLGAATLFVSSPSSWAAGEVDSVVADVLEMLEANVDEGVILQWLESTERRPGDVGSQGVIALTQAGATEELITVLLQRVDEPAVEADSEVSPVATGPAVLEEDAPVAAGTDGGSVESIIQLRAKQAWTDEDEPDSPRDPPWWVYLYLDGEFIGWTRPSMAGEPIETRRVIETGTHELRVVLQRYEDLKGGWHYESLVVPTLITFEARPGDPIEIDIEMKRIWGLWRQRKDGGPLRYLIQQGSRVLAEHGGTGGDPNRWSPVCEDVEANFPESADVPKRFRQAMKHCLRWEELWIGPGRATDRTAILARLAEYEFRPPSRVSSSR